MARYSKEHAERSRTAIRERAAELFRRHGYSGVGIDQLCGAAGLTRGAFYGHFRSKSALFVAVLEGAHDFVRRLKNRAGRTTEMLRRQGAQVAADYLSPANRTAVVSGCSLASLAMDTVRAGPAAQAAYADAVTQIVSELRRGADGEQAVSADRARAALALCIGGLLIDNACGSNREGEAVARAARREVRRLLSADGASEPKDAG